MMIRGEFEAIEWRGSKKAKCHIKRCTGVACKKILFGAKKTPLILCETHVLVFIGYNG